MYSSEDLERFYFQYQTEAMPKGISIEQFCSRNKVFKFRKLIKYNVTT